MQDDVIRLYDGLYLISNTLLICADVSLLEFDLFRITFHFIFTVYTSIQCHESLLCHLIPQN